MIPSVIPSLFAWLVVQTGAIALSALRVPLWPHAPQSGEFLAIPMLLTIQILASSLLAPGFLTDWRRTTLAAATSWPFVILAGLLAAAPVGPIFWAGLFLTGWIVAMSIAGSPLSSTSGRFRLSAALSAWAAAGPILLFVGREYDSAPLSPPAHWAVIAYGPLINALSVADPAYQWEIWPWLVFVVPVGIAVWGRVVNRVSGNVRHDESRVSAKPPFPAI